jgi:hypothetical protein
MAGHCRYDSLPEHLSFAGHCANLSPSRVGFAMKLYRVNKLAKPGGVVIKKKHILAESDHQAVKQAEDNPDCPVCDVLRDGETIGQIH